MSLSLVMSDHEFNQYNTLEQGLIWKILRPRLVDNGYLTGSECPVPNVEAHNYFDLFNVFTIRSSLNFLKPYYKYLCKLRAILKFPDEEFNDVRRLTTVIRDHDTSRPSTFTLQLKAETPQTKKECTIHVDGLKRLLIAPQWSTKILASIEREYPGMEKVKELMVITKVCVADRVQLYGQCGPAVSDSQQWKMPGPVVLGFEATKLKLAKNAGIAKEKIMGRDSLFKQEYWARMVPSNLKCTIIEEVLSGHSYDLTKGLPKKKRATQKYDWSDYFKTGVLPPNVKGPVSYRPEKTQPDEETIRKMQKRLDELENAPEPRPHLKPFFEDNYSHLHRH